MCVTGCDYMHKIKTTNGNNNINQNKNTTDLFQTAYADKELHKKGQL